MSEGIPTVVRLATDQLAAYNAADLDAFCACYHEDVVVLDDDGSESLRGAEAFRARYAPMFARGGFGARGWGAGQTTLRFFRFLFRFRFGRVRPFPGRVGRA